MPTQAELQQYASLAVHTGINLQPGQQLEIRAGIENLPLVREITRVAYEVELRKYMYNGLMMR